jgi:FemAB-related protein (PEP-CTERM system-associated)
MLTAATQRRFPIAMPITVSSEPNPEAWDRFVTTHPDGAAYHQYAWRTVFERAFDHRTEYLMARRGRIVVGVLPLVQFHSWLFGRFMVSLPFVNYGGVLADDAGVALALFDRASQVARERGLTHVELRHRARRFPDAPSKSHKVAMRLGLGASADAVWNGLDRKVRNQVRKAEKSGLSCATGGAALLDEFYTVFATNMRDLGTPVYAKRFFAEVLAAFPDRTTVFAVRRERETIAAGIGLRYRDTFEMPWASSLKAYRPLCANNLLYWQAISHAIAGGCATFDFGRSTPDEGTFHFKKQWGAEATPLCWEYSLTGRDSVPDQSPKNPRFAIAIEMWKRLPLAVAGVLGPPIVRSIP